MGDYILSIWGLVICHCPPLSSPRERAYLQFTVDPLASWIKPAEVQGCMAKGWFKGTYYLAAVFRSASVTAPWPQLRQLHTKDTGWRDLKVISRTKSSPKMSLPPVSQTIAPLGYDTQGWCGLQLWLPLPPSTWRVMLTTFYELSYEVSGLLKSIKNILLTQSGAQLHTHSNPAGN